MRDASAPALATPVDLNDAAVDLSALPRFQRAGTHVRLLLGTAAGLGAIALALLAATRHPSLSAATAVWLPLLRNTGSALLILALSVHAAYFVARWRCRAVGMNPWPWSVWLRQRLRVATTQPWYARWPRKAVGAAITVARRLGHELFQSLWLGGLALLALIAVFKDWTSNASFVPAGRQATIAGGVVLLAAFALLVLERSFAGRRAQELPEATPIAQIARVAIATLLLSSLSLFFSAEDALWTAKLVVWAGILPAIVAFEIAVRAVLSLFVRRDNALEPETLARSVFATLFRWPPRPLKTLQDELRTRFGIDLRQNWAFAYMRRATLPVLGAVAVIGWSFSGIREIPIDGRGIYERFGKPIEVLGPGLHAGLPWPLARIRAVENGVVHALATTIDADEAPDTSTAEGAAPDSANRLWDDAHVSEKSQIIASASGDRQNFQVVSMDVRFIYRIGLDDDAAMAATYHSADIPTLIRSTASRVLVRDFASRTLDGVLGEKRNVIASEIGRAVQADLDATNSGVEILATLLEQIHPPAGAANAYHGVQAALIKAEATIARERGRASNEVNDAQLKASMETDKAAATARESKARAEAVNLRFAAERNAYRTAGKAFLLEQYLSQLGQGLAGGRAIILDHRIAGNQAPTIDLRTYAVPGNEPVAARNTDP
jgi:regulator of protease activity HflC (stomatin/prohibitin superfamily)